MVFVKVDDKNEVVHIRYNYTPEMTEIDTNEGMIFDNLPIDEQIQDKYSRLMYDSVDNKLYYRYEDRVEPVDPITERINELEVALVEIASMLGGGQ